MGRQKSYNYIVIGSGTAGQKAALDLAARKNKTVAIVEAHQWAGSAANTFDTVYNTALEFSHLYYTARQGVKMGISSNNLRYNYPTALNYRNRQIRKARETAKQKLTDAGITCLKGFAHFINKKELMVGKQTLTADRFILATGTVFTWPQITGAAFETCYTSDDAFTIPRPPKRLAIVGGGESGCKIAQYYAELGSKVTLFEQKNRLLPADKVAAGAEIDEYLSQKLNVQVRTEAHVVAAEIRSHSQKLIWNYKKAEQSMLFDAIVLATGYETFTDFGLENTGVKCDKKGIMHDTNGRTHNKHIFVVE